MSAKKRILIIKPVLPYPPNQGTRVVSFELIRALSESFDVTVLARVFDREESRFAGELEQWCSRVVTVFPSNRHSFFHRVAYKLAYGIKSLYARRSMKSLYDCPGSFVSAARELAAGPENFDLVIIEYWQLFPLIGIFPRERVVLFTHDIDLLVNRQRALLERNLFRKVTAVRRWLLEQREEVRAYQSVDHILALTERDAHAARKLSKERAQVHVLPFGIEPDRFGHADGDRSDAEVLFMGAMHASFNRDALVFFAREVFPHLGAMRDATFTIVGGALPKELAFFGRDPRVNVVGRVGDVAPYLQRATCLLVPMRFGGGLRIRILEAMMAGLPIVTTSVGIAGMDFEPESEFLLADQPEDIAAALARVTENPDLARTLATNARTRVTERYGATAQRARTRALCQRLIEQ